MTTDFRGSWGMSEQVKPAEMRWSGHYCYCFGTKRPWVQIPPPRQQNAWLEVVCDRGAIAVSDQLRDYRILFTWCTPAVEALSAVHDGGRLPVAASGTKTRSTTVCETCHADPPREVQKPTSHSAER